ncbi:MAG: class I SAM-dependent methyltransferase [Bryobacteraceae bacterium]
MRVTAIEGHRIWASSYDAGPNPLLALETRLLLDKLGFLANTRLVDVACGTGRWMSLARQQGAQVFGADFSPAMLREASRKGLAGCLSLADANRLPFADDAADLALCSFALGYLPSPRRAIAEMARVTRKGGRVVVTDLHPCALAAGWTRSFRSDGQIYEIDHHSHPIADWNAPNLTLDWRLDAPFAEPERDIFRQAGKDFQQLSSIPALLAMGWIKS